MAMVSIRQKLSVHSEKPSDWTPHLLWVLGIAYVLGPNLTPQRYMGMINEIKEPWQRQCGLVTMHAWEKAIIKSIEIKFPKGSAVSMRLDIQIMKSAYSQFPENTFVANSMLNRL